MPVGPNDPTTRRTRRQVLKRAVKLGAGLVLTAPALLSPAGRANGAGSLMFGGSGGPAQRIQTKVFLDTFATETDIVVAQTSFSDPARLTAMAAADPSPCDLLSMSGQLAATLDGQGLLAPIPDGVIEAKDLAHAGWRGKGAVAWSYQTTGIGYDPKHHPGDAHPRTWAQFFDTAAFPGRRGLRARALETLEVALRADGVGPKDIYPLDVNRAFRSLQRIKPALSAWIKSTPQDLGLIRSDALDFNLAYMSQALEAQAAGAAVAVAIDEPVSIPECLAVPKGSPNKAAAFKLMAHWLNPARQARWAVEQPGSTPTVRKAFESLPQTLLAHLHRPGDPKEGDPKGVFIDVAWWAKNGAAADARFRKWMLT